MFYHGPGSHLIIVPSETTKWRKLHLPLTALLSKWTAPLSKWTACSKDYGHFPICINFTLSTPRENEYYCNDDKCVSEKIAWHKVTNFTDYQSLMSEMLSVNTVIGELSCLRCNDVNCENPIHLYEIDLLCIMSTDMCITAADATLPKVGAKCKFPGWSKEVQPLKNVAAFWGGQYGKRMGDHTLV